MLSPFFGEFMGTLVLVLLGDGVVASVLLKRSKAEGSGWIVITTGPGVRVMAGVFAAIACGSKDAFINPLPSPSDSLSPQVITPSSFLSRRPRCWALLWVQLSFGCISCLMGRKPPMPL